MSATDVRFVQSPYKFFILFFEGDSYFPIVFYGLFPGRTCEINQQLWETFHLVCQALV